LGLARRIVEEVVFAFVVNLMVDIADRVRKGIQVFRCVFLAHYRVILAFFESDFNWDAATMKVGLPVKVLDSQKSTFFIFKVDKCPELSLFKANRLDLAQNGEHFVKGLSGCLSW
jgi:hypothetical protein